MDRDIAPDRCWRKLSRGNRDDNAGARHVRKDAARGSIALHNRLTTRVRGRWHGQRLCRRSRALPSNRHRIWLIAVRRHGRAKCASGATALRRGRRTVESGGARRSLHSLALVVVVCNASDRYAVLSGITRNFRYYTWTIVAIGAI